MPKPRIIIADSDYSYIVPIQLKFAEEFFDKVELELITDEGYKESFFSVPQKADILIISEDMYSEDLVRHNIGRVFVMTEQPVEDGTSGSLRLQVDYIHKYTSIKEIFNEIVGKCANVLEASKVNKKKTQIIAVCSASGGTGKTTVAVGLAACLERSYKRVLYINADRLQSFHRFLANKSPINDAAVYSRLGSPDLQVFPDISNAVRKEFFSYLPPFKSALMSMGLQFKVYAMIAESAKRTNMYDFIIVDVNCGFDENLAVLLKIADKAVIITNNTAASKFATNLFVANVNGINSEKYLFICNDFDGGDETGAADGANYHVNEYIPHFEEYEKLTCENLMREGSMQKIAFLLT